MRVDHGRLQVAVAHWLLDRTNVLAALQQVGSEGMSQGVAAGGFADASSQHRPVHRSLDQARIQVVAALFTGGWILPSLELWKHPLPVPLPGSIGILARQGMGKCHSPPAVNQVPLVNPPHLLQMLAQLLREPFGKQGASVFPAFPLSHGQFSPAEVKVMHPQAQGLHEA